MIALSILILIAIFSVIYYKNKFARRNHLLKQFPAPPSLPIFGHALMFSNKTPQEVFYKSLEIEAIYKKIFHLSFGNWDDPFVFIMDAKIVEGFLTSQTLLDKSIDYDLLKPWIGNGLLISTDKKWFQRRKLLTPGFHFQILERFVEVMKENTEILAKKLDSFNGREVDVFPICNMFALDVVCECAMGIKLNSQIKDSEYARAVKDITAIIMKKMYDIQTKIHFIYKRTDTYKKEIMLLKLLHNFTENVIESRRVELLESSVKIEEVDQKKKKALLDILLTATVDGVSLSNEDIREEVDTFLFAGHDTTTSALSFIFYNIAKYPEVQQKVYEEVISCIVPDGKFNQSQLNDLHYTELVIKESLRLFPPVPMFGRKLREEVTIEGYTFPKECNVYFSSWGMGRFEKYFEDPETFNPERFNVETTYDKINPFAYVPFSAGPRNCIGQKFASLLLRSAISKIVKKFKLSLSDCCEDPLKLTLEVVLRPTNGIFIKFEKREK